MSSFIHKFIYSFNHGFTGIILACLFLVAVTLIIGFQSTVLTGFPKGYDSFDHLSLARIIRDNFPHVLWNPYWDEGSVLFPRNYPPLYHFSLGILAKIFPLDLPELLKWTAATNLTLTSIFLFLIVYLLSKNLAASLTAGLFYPASSGVWFYLVTTGLYSRIFAMMMLSFAILAVIYYFAEGKEKTWAYTLAVLGVVLVLLSHFLAVIMLGVFLFLMLFAIKGDFKEKTYYLAKILLPAILLVAFFYLPFFFLTFEHIIGEVGKESYEPFSLASLFKQSYPGFPFLSIPLSVFLLIVIFLTREKAKGRYDLRFFWVFALLAFACLSYVLGLYRNYFSGISPNHFLLPTVFFLAPFFGLGLSILTKRQILSPKLLFLLVVTLMTLGLAQVKFFEKNAYDMSVHWPGLSFTTLDESRLYRFGHRDEVLGGAFNFYSPALQTRGYWEPGLLFPDFHFWFEEGVFATSNNLEETKFLLDWFGVKSLYLTKQPGALAKFGQDASGKEYLYKEARPILLATRSPVLLFKGDEKGYLKLLKELAKKDLDSRFLIPIQDRTARKTDFTAWVLGSVEEAEGTIREELADQKPKFVHSQRREIELEEKFTGLVLKENYFPNWTATAEYAKEDGKTQKINLKIFQAGPGMMYVPLPVDYSTPAKAIFEYRGSLIEKTGFLISFVTLIWIILSCFGVNWSGKLGRAKAFLLERSSWKK